MGLGLKRTIFLWVILALGLAGCPAVSPVGRPANPAGIASSNDKSNSDRVSSPDDPFISNGIDNGSPTAGGSPSGSGSGTPPPPNAPPNGGGGISTDGSSVAMANGGSTFCPKGDNEKMGDDLLREATDWRLRFGVNAWWELSRTVPEPFPVFKNTTTDFQMKLEALTPNCGWILVLGPNVHAVYQPKGQPPAAAQVFDAAAGGVAPDGYNVQLLGLNLEEGTVTFSADSNGTQHSLGSIATYLSSAPSQLMAPSFNQTVK